MRFAGNIFNEGEQESEDDSMLSRYFPDLKKIYESGVNLFYITAYVQNMLS
jgi:hypothetical protein